MNKRKSILKNNWVIGTGSSLLAVIILKLVDIFLHTKIISSIITGIKWLFNYILGILQIRFEVAIWILILIPIITIVIIALIIWIGIKREVKKEIVTESPALGYKEDIFGSVLYRWNYVEHFDNKYVISDLTYHCSKCKCLLVYDACPICHISYYNQIKSREVINALILHKIESIEKAGKL